MKKNPFILGICGGKWGCHGVGKTAAASILERKKGFFRISLLDPVEKIAKSLHGWNGKRDENGLVVLDRICRTGRAISEDYWLNLVLAGMSNINTPVVMDDVYFPNEVEFIRKSGGKVLKISRKTILDEDRGMLPDAEIPNDGTLQDLEREVLLVSAELEKISHS